LHPGLQSSRNRARQAISRPGRLPTQNDDEPIFQPGLSLEDVTILIDRLLSRLARSRLKPFTRLAKTIRKHRDGILAAIRLGINQGRTEALNNKVRLITRRAYGFHSADAALALIMLTCGPITLHLPHELDGPGIA